MTRAEPTIAAILIAKNEEANIAYCLATLSFCDQIVVVDGGSSDKTAQIAREAGAIVVVRADWAGFGIQKQRSLDLATQDWILSIDADERVPEALRDEIRTALRSSRYDAYRLNRLSMFLGRFLRHGGWFPDPVLRLARRECCKFNDAIVHESLIAAGPVGTLGKPLIHYSYQTVDDVLRKLRQYALTSAQVRRRRGKRGGLFSALVRANLIFLRVYFLQMGLLDGGRGLVAAIYRAQETFWRYLAVGWEKKQ